MTEEQRIFIKLLSCATLGKSDLVVSCDFNKIENLSISHYCGSLVSYGASLCNLELPKEWIAAASITVFNNYKNLSAQKNVIHILKENDIPCAIIKGITAAVNYANPLSRALGDIDILIEPHNYKKAMNIFGIHPEDNMHKFHFSFIFQGISVEIHKAIDKYDKCLNGEKLSIAMSNALDEIQYVKFDGFEIPALLPKYQALVYLNHMIRHFDENELSMRMFCDWATFSNKIDNEKWLNEIYPLIKNVGYEYYADVINLAAHKYFRANTANKACKKFSDKIVEEFMEDFVYESKRKGEDFLNGNIVTEYLNNKEENDGFIKMSVTLLNSIAYKEFYLSRYKILLPFCWCYILLRYTIRVIIGKRKRISYGKIKNTVNRRDYLKKMLKLK